MSQKTIFFILSDLAENHDMDLFWHAESKNVGYFDPRGVVSNFSFLVREPGGPLRPLCDPFLESQIWLQITIKPIIGERNPKN